MNDQMTKSYTITTHPHGISVTGPVPVSHLNGLHRIADENGLNLCDCLCLCRVLMLVHPEDAHE